MTAILSKNPATLMGETYDGEKFYESKGITYFQTVENNASSDTLNHPLGKSVSIKYNYKEVKDIATLHDLFFHLRINNESSTESPTLHNPYALFEKIEITNNFQKNPIVLEREELIVKYNEYLMNCKNREHMNQELFKNHNLLTESTTLTGLVVPVSSYLDVRIDLMAILPDVYRNHVFGNLGTVGPFQHLEITLHFSPNVANADTMTEYVKSNTSNNAWTNDNLSFSHLKFVRRIRYTSDPNLLNFGKIKAYTTAYTKYVSDGKIPWNVVGTNYFLFRPHDNGYSKQNNILGFLILLRKKLTGTSFNQADSCKYYSGPSYIGWSIKKDNVEIMNLTGADKLHERQKYFIDYVRNRYDQSPLIEMLDNSTNLNKYILVGGTYIDMSNLKTESVDGYAVSTGVSNNSTSWEIKLTCEGAVDASCEMVIFFHTYQVVPLT